MANYLLDEEDAAEYLRQVLADGDPARLLLRWATLRERAA